MSSIPAALGLTGTIFVFVSLASFAVYEPSRRSPLNLLTPVFAVLALAFILAGIWTEALT